jgi:hypothetical protein
MPWLAGIGHDQHLFGVVLDLRLQRIKVLAGTNRMAARPEVPQDGALLDASGEHCILLMGQDRSLRV